MQLQRQHARYDKGKIVCSKAERERSELQSLEGHGNDLGESEKHFYRRLTSGIQNTTDKRNRRSALREKSDAAPKPLPFIGLGSGVIPIPKIEVKKLRGNWRRRILGRTAAEAPPLRPPQDIGTFFNVREREQRSHSLLTWNTVLHKWKQWARRHPAAAREAGRPHRAALETEVINEVFNRLHRGRVAEAKELEENPKVRMSGRATTPQPPRSGPLSPHYEEHQRFEQPRFVDEIVQWRSKRQKQRTGTG